MSKRRIMYLLRSYPQLSQTYVNVEINAVKSDYELAVIALRGANLQDDRPLPYRVTSDLDAIIEAVRQFRPHVLHSHYLINIHLLTALARATGIPFTIRAHSFDAMPERFRNQVMNASRAAIKGRVGDVLRWALGKRLPLHLHDAQPFNDDYCLGILAFPYTRPLLEKAGIRPDKIIDCYPVVDYGMFHDEAENGKGVMNLGAAMRKKRMDDFIRLGEMMPGTQFDLYGIGHITDELHRCNASRGNPVTIHEAVQHRYMPAIYKQHAWLCYTACPKYASVGWPLAVAEAQAAGVGICLPNLRPDLREFVGGAGFFYDNLEQARKILSGPVPDEIRQRGFLQAKKSDIATHKHLLTDLWDSVPA